MRLIDADALKKHYAWWEDDRQKLFDSIVDQQPTVDAVPARHGKWIGYAGTVGAECSLCRKWMDVLQGTAEMNYCPNCGARMDEE